MNVPAVNTEDMSYTANASKDSDLPVDSAIQRSPALSDAFISNVETRDKPVDEKEKRLADYVSKMDELRMTTGEEGFKIQQGIKVKTIVKALLVDSDSVCRFHH
jgi:hypothetical protein